MYMDYVILSYELQDSKIKKIHLGLYKEDKLVKVGTVGLKKSKDIKFFTEEGHHLIGKVVEIDGDKILHNGAMRNPSFSKMKLESTRHEATLDENFDIQGVEIEDKDFPHIKGIIKGWLDNGHIFYVVTLSRDALLSLSKKQKTELYNLVKSYEKEFTKSNTDKHYYNRALESLSPIKATEDKINKIKSSSQKLSSKPLKLKEETKEDIDLMAEILSKPYNSHNLRIILITLQYLWTQQEEISDYPELEKKFNDYIFNNLDKVKLVFRDFEWTYGNLQISLKKYFHPSGMKETDSAINKMKSSAQKLSSKPLKLRESSSRYELDAAKEKLRDEVEKAVQQGDKEGFSPRLFEKFLSSVIIFINSALPNNPYNKDIIHSWINVILDGWKNFDFEEAIKIIKKLIPDPKAQRFIIGKFPDNIKKTEKNISKIKSLAQKLENKPLKLKEWAIGDDRFRENRPGDIPLNTLNTFDKMPQKEKKRKKKKTYTVAEGWATGTDQASGKRYNSDEEADKDEFEKMVQSVYYDLNAWKYAKSKKKKKKVIKEDREHKTIMQARNLGREEGFTPKVFEDLIRGAINSDGWDLASVIGEAKSWKNFNYEQAKKIIFDLNQSSPPALLNSTAILYKILTGGIEGTQDKINMMKDKAQKLESKPLKLKEDADIFLDVSRYINGTFRGDKWTWISSAVKRNLNRLTKKELMKLHTQIKKIDGSEDEDRKQKTLQMILNHVHPIKQALKNIDTIKDKAQKLESKPLKLKEDAYSFQNVSRYISNERSRDKWKWILHAIEINKKFLTKKDLMKLHTQIKKMDGSLDENRKQKVLSLILNYAHPIKQALKNIDKIKEKAQKLPPKSLKLESLVKEIKDIGAEK